MDQSSSRDALFGRLFDSHRDALRLYCFRRLGHDQADDAVAEVFVVAWRKIDEAPAGDEARLWLYGIARNVVRNARRSQVRWHRLNVRLGSLGSYPEPGPEPQVVQRAQDRELLTAVTRLPSMEQELIRLHTWEGLAASEIAAVTGLSVRAVETRLSRIRKKLARRLGPPSTMEPVVPSRTLGEGEQ